MAPVFLHSPAARAQRPDRPRSIGILMSTTDHDAEGTRRVQALLAGLERLGWQDGRNIRITHRWTGGDPTRTQSYVRELVALEPDVIVCQNTLATKALLTVTRRVAVVFTQVTEPVAAGFVESVARPGGNATGFTSFEPGISSKWLDLLKQLAPRVRRVGLLSNPEASQLTFESFLRAAKDAAPTLGVDVIAAPFRSEGEIQAALSSLSREPDSGLVVIPDASTNANRSAILALVEQHRLPAIYGFPFFVRAGGLVSYGPDPIDQFGKAAAYVDRILKGESPSGLPVQQPTKFEVAVNLTAARTLGLVIPPSVLGVADEVIE